MKANISSLLVGIAALAMLVFVYGPHTAWSPMRAAGALLALVAGVLLVVARLQLGSSFSIKPEARALVTTGLYARMRNPIYLFSALLLAGLTLYFERPWLLLILGFLFGPIQIYRARKEEQALHDAFGDAYTRYKAKTWF